MDWESLDFQIQATRLQLGGLGLGRGSGSKSMGASKLSYRKQSPSISHLPKRPQIEPTGPSRLDASHAAVTRSP